MNCLRVMLPVKPRGYVWIEIHPLWLTMEECERLYRSWGYCTCVEK